MYTLKFRLFEKAVAATYACWSVLQLLVGYPVVIVFFESLISFSHEILLFSKLLKKYYMSAIKYIILCTF
jgi:hypothetical protein